jgi:hypothetical protein
MRFTQTLQGSLKWRHGTQENDNWHNGIRLYDPQLNNSHHDGVIYDILHNDTESNNTECHNDGLLRLIYTYDFRGRFRIKLVPSTEYNYFLYIRKCANLI